MKVAIMGAGLSGLACAKFLEDNGIEPVIFERRHRVGERFPNMEAIIQPIHRPIEDPLIYLNKNFGINLVPAGIVHTIEIHSPNKTAVISGYNLGYSTIRGHDDRSLERQLQKQVRSEIKFNSTYTLPDIEKRFDWVVISTGDPTIARDLGVWQSDMEIFVKGCLIKGKFTTGMIKMFLNQELSKQGYVFIVPYDTDEASVCVAATNSSPADVDILWEKTIKYLNINPVPKTEFKVDEYKIGRVSKRQVGKILLAGNAGGFIDPFLGFGQIPSILSGVYAANSILSGEDFNKLTNWYHKPYLSSLTLRKYMDELNNDDFDKIVNLLNFTLIRKLAVKTNLRVIDLLAGAIRLKRLIKKQPP